MEKKKSIQDSAKKQFQHVKAEFIAKEQKAENFIKEHPIKAVGIAAGIGLAVGATAMTLARCRE